MKTYMSIVDINTTSVEMIADQANITYEEAEKYVVEVMVPQIEESIQMAFEEAHDMLYRAEEEN